jgi:cathepsin B
MVASFAAIAAAVNSGNNTWTAQVPARFASVEDVKAHLGAHLPGDDKYETSPVKEMDANLGDLPDSFDSATQWPQCTVIANVRDQSACGSCWAFGSVSSFESRACITTGNDVKYSPQATAFNQGIFGAGNGCNGGNSAWGFFKNTGVPTGGDYTDIGAGDTCQPYGFAPCAHHVPATEKYPACPSGEYPNPRKSTKCSEDSYTTDFKTDSLHASKTYSVRGVDNMMQELVTNGPMYVSFTVYDDFPTYKSGVYQPTSHKALGGHAVTLVGYGTWTDGTPYWKIKNSWNEQWGDGGHFLIVRGKNACGIESDANAGDIQTSYETTV